MKRVMQMKKALIVILALVLILGGLFFWKGGHHALALADILEEWLDADDADQSLTLHVQIPGAQANAAGQFEPHIRQLSLSADTFWTEYADRRLFGLTAQGVTAYTDGKNLYMDTGKTYALPDLSGLRKSARRLALGLLLYGRVTKTGDTYNISMKSDELELNIDLTADRTVQAVSIIAVLPDDTTVCASMTATPTVSHPIPRQISDAVVRARMEPPMALTEPLEVLLPALENLLPLEGDLTLGVDCGILELAETVGFSMDSQAAELDRKGVIVSIDLPGELSGADPAVLGLLLLRNGTFSREGDSSRFELTLPAETTRELCAALVPQIRDLGIGFSESHATLTITDGKLTSASLIAEGEVPFLVTTIPVAFQAELMVH